MVKSALFPGKNCLVIGAAHPIGRAMCLRLVDQGGFVIAVDSDEDAVQDLASLRSDRIAPLAMSLADCDGLDHLAAHWADDPLHVLVMAQALNGAADLGATLTSIEHTTKSLASALAASDGAALVLFAVPEEGGKASGRAAAAALATLTGDLAATGVRINALMLHSAALQSGAFDQICTTAMMMALPMARAVSGSVLPVGRHGLRLNASPAE